MGLEILYYLLNILWLAYGFYEKLYKKIKASPKSAASTIQRNASKKLS